MCDDARRSCTTWFGDNPAYVHGIQMMPFTPITEELLLPTFVANECVL